LINNLKYLLVVLFLANIFTGCSSINTAKTKEYILWKNEFKGNEKILSEELNQIIPFSLKENSKPFGLPFTPRVWWYNIGTNKFDQLKNQEKLDLANQQYADARNNTAYNARKIQKLEKKIEKYTENNQENNAWFWRNIGEKQVVIDPLLIQETTEKIKKYYFDIGYRDAEIKFELDTLTNRKKIIVKYIIKENTPYEIDSVLYFIDDTKIDSLLNKNLQNAQIKKGDLFDLRLVEAEKQRLEQLLKNNGYFNFSSKFLLHGATNKEESEELFIKNKKGILKIEILNPSSSKKHQQYSIEEVIFKAFDPNNSKETARPDTIIFNDLKFIRLDKRIPLGVISERILSKPNSIFKVSDILETQRQIGMFNQFAFASSQVKPISADQLSVEYFAPLQDRYTFGISPGINNIYNDGTTFFGFGVPVSLTARNRFNKLETLEASMRASYEGQPSPLISQGSQIRGSLEMGVNLNLTLPSIWFFNQNLGRLNLKNPRTIMGIGFNYSEPFWGKRLNFKLNTNYSIQYSKYAFLYISLLDANLINTTYSNNIAGRSFYNSLIELQQKGNNLKVTFDPQFVSSINANFVFNNQNPAKLFSNSKFFRIFIESGGTILNLLNDKDRIGLIEKVFPLNIDGDSPDSVRAYFRFVKLNVDYRRNINISSSSSYAYRFNLGLTNPYGTNRSLPFEKNFFIGGSNSVRAWAPRTLGTGSAGADTTTNGNTIPQPGDILLESSLEYRLKVFRFAGDIQIAGFIDAGNVWKWHQINIPEKQDKSNFDLTRFYKEIAVGTGFGIRWDLSYFLFRFDWGIKVIDPSRPLGQRFVLDEFTLRRRNPYGLNWNFGIGYPF
jgi:outer membrane protein insertion porin family